MKKKATARPAKATSRQPTLNFPTSSEADLVAESIAVPVSSAPSERNKIAQGKKRSAAALGQHPSTTESPEGATEPSSSAKNRGKRTADFADDADKHNETNGDSSVPASSAPSERNKIAQGKKRSAAALGQHPSTTESPEGATEPSSSAKNRRKRTADFADDTDKHNKSQCDSSAISAQSAVKKSSTDVDNELVRLPNGWRWVTLREIADISGGITKGQKYRETDILRRVPYLRVANVQRGYLDLTEMKEIDATETKIAALQLQPGDILFNEGGDRDKLGRGWIWNNEVPVCIHQNHVFRARLRNTEHSPRFVSYYSNSAGQQYFYDQGKHTTNLASINLTKLGELPIPLPPPAEQHRIVAEIEKQFTRLDAGVAALKRVQANLKRYRAAVLKAACEGKLVPTEAELANRGGTNFQSGAELLAAISDSEANDLNPRRAGRLWGAGHVPDLTDEERLSLPDGWVWAKVRELGFDPENAVQVGPMSMKSSDFTDAGTPVLNVGCVQWGRFVESKLDHLPAEKAAEFERYRIKCGDVLFTRSGTVGRCAVSQPHQDGWLMTFHLLRARPNPQKCLPPFLRIVFEGAPHIRRQTRDASVGSTRAGFNTNLLGNLAVPLPPLAEQTRIVAEVERRLSVVEELEAVVSANLQRAARLRQSILQKAFTGELV